MDDKTALGKFNDNIVDFEHIKIITLEEAVATKAERKKIKDGLWKEKNK